MNAVGDSEGPGVQQSLLLTQPQPQDRASFIASACNAHACAVIDAWPSWPGGKLALVGPEGSGKSHLAMAWAMKLNAQVVEAADCAATAFTTGRAVLVENADRGADDQALFHLFERAAPDAPLLLTARTAPRAWATDMPDLRSRLAALMVAELQTPDDVVLEGVLARYFRERNIRPRKNVLEYLVRRIERSAPAARAVVERIDVAAASDGRSVTRDLAREVLGADPGEPELVNPPRQGA